MGETPTSDAGRARRAGRVAAKALRRIARWTLRIAPVVLVLTLARSTLADQYHVPTASMWPTIEPGDRIFVSKAAYGLRLPFTNYFITGADAPVVGDVVVFADPRGGPIPLVKRVVARAGQSVALVDGTLFVDGRPQTIERLEDGRVVEHLGARAHDAGSRDFEDYGPTIVPADHVFVMGDNRAVSLDSRVFGPVALNLLRGRVVGTSYRLEDERVDGTGSGSGLAIDASRILHRIE